MADGLFSYKTPGQLQQDYLGGLMQPVGGGDLYSQLIQTMSNAGRIAGYGAGRMFGGQVPGEEKNAAIQRVFEQVKGIADPIEQYNKAAELFAQSGFPDLAMQARKTAQQEKLTGLKLKSAEREEEEATALTARKKQQQNALDEAISSGASDKDLLRIYSQYAPPDVAFDALNKRILANEKREADIIAREEKHRNRMEEIQQRAQDKEFLLRISNASREDIAAENRRSREAMATMSIASREMLSRERIAAQLEQARLVSELRNRNMPKDAAEAAADIDAVLSNQARGLELIKRIDSPEVSEKAFTNFNAVKHFLNAQVGVATDESILVEDTRTWIREQVNTILQAAKGVQTEGDAQRAEQIIAATTGKLTKRGMLNAIQKVIDFSNDIAKRKDKFVEHRTGRRYLQTATPVQSDPAGLR